MNPYTLKIHDSPRDSLPFVYRIALTISSLYARWAAASARQALRWGTHTCSARLLAGPAILKLWLKLF